jgi:ABC-type glycerol-3-phosphate transport system permease component
MMAKNRKKVLTSGVERFNRVSLPTNILFSLIFILLALLTVIPLIFVIIVSFSSAESVRKNRLQLCTPGVESFCLSVLMGFTADCRKILHGINRHYSCRYNYRIVS